MNQFVYEGHRTYRNRGVAVAAIVVVGLTALALAIVAVLCWMIKISIDRSGYTGSLDTASTLERVVDVAARAYGVLQLASLALTIIWLWRARKNLDAFPDAKPSIPAGWAIGGWFLPIANLFVPGRIMANAARESTHNRWVTRVAVIWWIALLVTWIADRVGNLWAENALYAYDTVDPQLVSNFYGELARGTTVAGAAGVIAAAAFAFTVSRTSAAQEERIYRGWYEEENRALSAPSGAPTALGGVPAEPPGAERWDPAASSEAGQGIDPAGVGPDAAGVPGRDVAGSPGAGAAGAGTGPGGAGTTPVADPVIGVTPRAAAPDGDGSATIGA
ncbi:DUF4328 domain-containing protein [Asanoa sp. NPDC049518]|uniref:DUF4328 domain-containing protein n=1 Tax=unclassified Asanoa TaxID=2685164 RepID=UPI00341C7E5A